MEEKTSFKDCVLHNLWFKILSAVSIILMIISFFMPPQGTIDPSVIAGVGEIFAFAALGTVIYAIDKGKETTISHGSTSMTIRDENNDNE